MEQLLIKHVKVTHLWELSYNDVHTILVFFLKVFLGALSYLNPVYGCAGYPAFLISGIRLA